MSLSFPPLANARIITVAGKRVRVELADGSRVEAVTRGRILYEGGLVVGDYVQVEANQDQFSVESVLTRETEFIREGLRKERQVLFANVDRVLIFAALAQPQTKAATIDRFWVAALHGGIPAALILTKTDLDKERAREVELRSLYDGFDLAVHAVCNLTGDGFEPVLKLLPNQITAMVGNSGVGKTAFLNRAVPGLDLRVREVSAWSGKGTHTTTAGLLVRLDECTAVIDTPGMKSFVPFGVTRETLPSLFPDIMRFASDCRFRNCRHGSEPDCAVLAAAEKGDLPASRLRSYHRLMDELH